MIVFSGGSSHVKLVPEMNPAYDIDSNLSPRPMDCPSRLNWNVGTAVRHLGDWIRREAHLGNVSGRKALAPFGLVFAAYPDQYHLANVKMAD
jgi:hypothetical protein